MAFEFEFFKKGILIRLIMKHEGQIKMQRGELLELEKANPRVSGLTFATINSLLEEDFTRISGSQIVYRFKKVNFIETDEQFLKMKEHLDKSPALKKLLRDEIAKKLPSNINSVSLQQTILSKDFRKSSLINIKGNLKRLNQFIYER